jgi:NTE family protein
MKVPGILCAAFLALSAPVAGAVDTTEEVERPRIGLALSGGGARGSAHVGVLRMLDELGVPVDYIAGTSMGSIIGALYASGYTADGIQRVLDTMDWETALTDRPDRIYRTMRRKELESDLLIPYRLGFNKGSLELPLGVIEGQHLDQVLHHLLMPVVDIRSFDELEIPFRAVATDLVSGEEVVLSSGSLPNALRASMSVPGVFAPVDIDGRLLVDGGMSNNLPVSVVRAMGADIVIAVDISAPMLEREQLTSVISVTEQLTNFLTRRSTDAQIASLGEDDILIVPELDEFASTDFTRVMEILDRGYQAARLQRDGLARLMGEARDSAEDAPAPAPEAIVVDFIRLDNDSVLSDTLIRSRLGVDVGQTIDLAALNASVDRIYSLDVFQSVTYDFVENERGETGLEIHARRRLWGPNYLQFGMELSSDFGGTSEYTVGAAYTRNALNALGGELRVTASLGRRDQLAFDFYQPIDPEARWYVRPEAYWSRETYRLWDDGVNIARFELGGWGTDLALGRNFSTTDRLQLEYRFGKAEIDLLTGPPGFEARPIDLGELRLEYLHDSLDSLWFPSSGAQHRLNYLHASPTLGADSRYRQATLGGVMAFALGRNRAALSYEMGYSFDDAAGIERWYRLGGFGRLSGLAPDELLGRHAGLATLSLYRKLNDLDVLSVYAGATLEAGNVWNLADEIGLDDLRYSGSLFLGAESPLGPAYLAAGYSDSGDFAIYFYLGNPFRVSLYD